jgi:carbon-monoxide dehydrogenase iron sulfur subunit
MKNPKEIFVKLDKCMGCQTCRLACSVEHSAGKNLYAALAERPLSKSRVYVEWVGPDNKIPVLCRHCEDAPCMHACISGAITQDADGIVSTDDDKCIGCWTCVMVCPYGVIGRQLEEQKSYRCDRCPDRETPACVESCPVDALVYRTVESFSGQKRQEAAGRMLSGEEGQES